MADLKHTKIYRGGLTSPYQSMETRECSFHANTGENALDIRFNLASKGGGTTSVLVQVGLDDLPVILEAVANTIPESVGVLLDCAAVAYKRNLGQLREARKVQNDEKVLAKSLIEK